MGTQPQNNCIGLSHCPLHRPNSASLALAKLVSFSFCLPILSVSRALATPAPFSFCLQNLQVSRAFAIPVSNCQVPATQVPLSFGFPNFWVSQVQARLMSFFL
ncbi:hypothetical protein PRUPE_8G013800 [Prunus persica]|uniref:Uncharacterized protein n=1 Tax=Prunus persica TaxID=3760 RepID=A0A251MR49_PRUPE|nr:hypothetical protein PRUPE_8G013800 [Prunus persica]